MEPRLFDLDFQLLADSALMIIAVFALFLVASYFLFDPVRDMMKKRSDKIKGELDDAAKSQADAAALKEEYENRLKDIDKEAEKILSDARKRALENENKIVADAKEEAAGIIERARTETELEKQKAADDMKREMVVLASMMAGKVVKASIDTTVQEILINDTLIELAVEEGQDEEFLQEIEAFKKILDTNPDFGKLMNHPNILKEEKLKVVEEVFKGHISRELLGFLHIVVVKDRYSEIDAILDYFIDEVKKEKGIGVAYVSTACGIDEAQKKEIEERLLATTHFKKMEMHYQVEEDLIGGMVIRIGDRVVDSSVKTKLYELQRQLLKVQL